MRKSCYVMIPLLILLLGAILIGYPGCGGGSGGGSGGGGSVGSGGSGDDPSDTETVGLPTRYFKGKISISEGSIYGIDGASVSVNGETVTTDYDGEYFFDNIQTGANTIKIFQLGYVEKSENINISDGENVYSTGLSLEKPVPVEDPLQNLDPNANLPDDGAGRARYTGKGSQFSGFTNPIKGMVEYHGNYARVAYFKYARTGQEVSMNILQNRTDYGIEHDTTLLDLLRPSLIVPGKS